MASSLEPDDDIFEDDYYAVLNVPKDATTEQINQAYKQQSKIYHPDKHADPKKKEMAEHIFRKLKRAQEVLSDQHTRVVYDLHGTSGLDSASGMEVVPRTKTPAEIIAEYEKLQRIKEDELLHRKTQPTGMLVMEIDATDAFEPLEDDEYSNSIYMNRMGASGSVQCPLTTRNSLTMECSVTSHNGQGSGVFGVAWKRILRDGFFTVGTAVKPGEGINVACTLHKKLFKFCTGTLTLTVPNPGGDLPLGAIAGITYIFSQHWTGGMNLAPQGLTTRLSYEDDRNKVNFSVHMMLENSYLSASYYRMFEDKQGSTQVTAILGIGRQSIKCGITKKITSYSKVHALVTIGIPVGVRLKLTLEQGNYSIVVPIRLSEEILPSSITFATIMPLAVYLTVKKLIVDPFLSSKKEQELQRKKEEQQEKIAEKRNEALAQVDLMRATVEKSRDAEEARNGLIIVRGLYGKLSTMEEDGLLSEECIDVTVPLQALVQNSKLISFERDTKSGIPGFYDPCIGEEKQLYIKYKFRSQLHHTTIGDKETIRLPQQRHLLREDELPPSISPSEAD